MALISVIVPVYNVEMYLKRCVDSILVQSFSDFELILVDDGSQDHCGEICDEFAKTDPRVYVIHQQNGGLSAARNAGLDHAFAHSNSEWITFIDSDDWVHTDYLLLLYNAANQFNCIVSICSFLRTDGTVQQAIYPEVSPELITPEVFWVSNRVNATIACGKLYFKELFNGIRYPVGKLHEDEFVTYKLLFTSDRIVFIQNELYYYYTNPSGIMNKQWSTDRVAALRAFSEQCTYFHKNRFFKAEGISAQEYFICCIGVLNRLLSLYPENVHLLRKTRRELRRILRKYKKHLDISMVGSKKSLDRLAHPIYTKLRVKWKHAFILLRRILHA